MRRHSGNRVKPWKARVHLPTGDTFLGYFATKEEAEQVEYEAREIYGISHTRRERGLKSYENRKVYGL